MKLILIHICYSNHTDEAYTHTYLLQQPYWWSLYSYILATATILMKLILTLIAVQQPDGKKGLLGLGVLGLHQVRASSSSSLAEVGASTTGTASTTESSGYAFVSLSMCIYVCMHVCVFMSCAEVGTSTTETASTTTETSGYALCICVFVFMLSLCMYVCMLSLCMYVCMYVFCWSLALPRRQLPPQLLKLARMLMCLYLCVYFYCLLYVCMLPLCVFVSNVAWLDV